MNFKTLFIIFFFLFFSGCASKVIKLDINKKKIEDTHKVIGEGWKTFNVNVDRFFSEGRFDEHTNNSYIRIKNVVEIIDGEDLVNYMDLKLQTDFPNTSKDLLFVLQTERGNAVDNLTTAGRARASKSRTSRVSTAGRFKIKTLENWKMHFDLGLEFKVPLDPFAKYRVRRRFKSRRHRLDLIQNINYFRIERLEHESQAEYIYGFNRRNSIKSINSFLYRWADQEYSFYNTLSWLSKLSSKKTLSYSVGANGESEPIYKYTDYSVSIGLRQKVFKDWFFIEPTLGLNFSNVNRFHRRGFVYLLFDAFL